jgi:hypothetical protein
MFPSADGSNRKFKFLGNLLEGEIIFQPPIAEGDGKIPVDVTLMSLLCRHGVS